MQGLALSLERLTIENTVNTENYDIMEKVISNVGEVERNCYINSEERKSAVTLRERRRWRK